MHNEKDPNTTQEIERLANPKAQCPETDEDPKTPSKLFDADSKFKEHEPEPEQALEFLTGGERYTQD